MRRLGIVAMALALVVVLAFGAGAFALYVWPGKESAPSLVAPRYSAVVAVGRVRAALETEGECKEETQHIRWAAYDEPQRDCWVVAELCRKEAGPPVLDSEEPLADVAGAEARWLICEEDGVVVPLTDLAASFMRPRRE
jgi:hypothetical protein